MLGDLVEQFAREVHEAKALEDRLRASLDALQYLVFKMAVSATCLTKKIPVTYELSPGMDQGRVCGAATAS